MGGGRKTQPIIFNDYQTNGASSSYNSQTIAKLMHKADLAGVIFGCTYCTITECFKKQIFGLPGSHMNYIRNIEPGLPLFLFNYSNRMLHGVYESATSGQLNIDPYAWTENGKERTAYPAQVRIQNKTYCQPIPEIKFRSVIAGNYYSSSHFYFELDHKQVKGLLSLFVTTPRFQNVGFPPKRNLTKPFPAYKNSSKPDSDILHSKKQLKAPERKSWAGLFSENTSRSYSDWDNNSSIKASSDCATKEDENTKIVCAGYADTKEIISDWEDLCHDDKHSNSENCDDLKQKQSEHESNGDDLLVEKERMLDHINKIETWSLVEKVGFVPIMDVVNSTRVEPLRVVNADKLTSSSLANKTNTIEEPKERLEEKSSHLENAELMRILKELKEGMILMEAKKIETQREADLLIRIVKDSEKEYQSMQQRVKDLESKVGPTIADIEETPNDSSVELYLGCEKSIYLIGGYNGETWLDAMDSYSPKLDILTPLKKLSCPRSYAAATIFNDVFYVFGGGCGDGDLWHKSVEFYNPTSNEWTSCPSLAQENGSLAGATLNGKMYAIGGGNGKQYFSNVEMFDPLLGKWIYSQSMLQKRFALAASELNGVLYAVGGFDGSEYLNSAERYDRRESTWARLPSMNTRRGCHSMAVLNDKLYVLGGYDGNQMVSSTEIFDPRANSWLASNPMNSMRGYAGTVVFNGSLLVIGGVKDMNSTVDTVECYQEDVGWVVTGLKAPGTRSFFSTIVI